MEQKWWVSLYGVFFGIHVSEELKKLRGAVILHIADTPSTFYGAIRRLILLLDPPWIIHTGDLADNVKLELVPGDLPRYRRKLRNLRSALSAGGGRQLFFVTGNHDDGESIRELFPESTVFSGRGRTKICGVEFNLSHDRRNLIKPPSRFNLFGHEPSLPDSMEQESFFKRPSCHPCYCHTGWKGFPSSLSEICGRWAACLKKDRVVDIRRIAECCPVFAVVLVF